MTVQDDLTSLYKAIVAKAAGKQVSQAGHKDKQASYANVPIKDIIALYRQLWFKDCGLPELNDLGQPATRRGPAFRLYGRR